MNLSFSEIAVAIGLLTPLTLGILSFIDKRFPGKKQALEDQAADRAAEPVAQGLTVGVDFASELIAELKRDREQAERDLADAVARERALKVQLDTYREIDRR